MFNKSGKKNTSKLRLTKSAEQKADKKLNSPNEPPKAAELNQSNHVASTTCNDVTGSQSNVSWRLSNHVLEFYGTGEFCIDDILYSSDLQFADILLPGPMVDIDDYCAPWCYDKEKESLLDKTEIHTIRFHPGFTVIRYDFCWEKPSIDGFCGGRYTGCSKLHDVHIPASVTDIDKNAFSDACSPLVIHAPLDSFAEQWAKENGYRFEPTT